MPLHGNSGVALCVPLVDMVVEINLLGARGSLAMWHVKTWGGLWSARDGAVGELCSKPEANMLLEVMDSRAVLAFGHSSNK